MKISKENNYNIDLRESSEQLQLNEIYYNCTECSSSIEILSINGKECSIEFRCINNNHKIKMSIKEYFEKMQDYNDKNINFDICQIHNNKYECYCLDCKIHLCKECLKLRNHINHTKNNIIEIQPSSKEIDIIKNLIKYYNEKIEKLEKIKLKKAEELKESKNKLNETKETKIKNIRNEFKKELKSGKDIYNSELKNITKENDNEIKLRKYQYKIYKNGIRRKYKLMIDKINIIYENEITKLDNKYIRVIQKYKFAERIDKLKSLNRLNEIVYNAYNMHNNNYYNSQNINNILIDYHKNKIYLNDDLNKEFENIIKVKNVKEDLNIKIFEFEEKIKIYENLIDKIKKEYNILNSQYDEAINNKTLFLSKDFSNGKYEGEFKNGKREGKGIMYYNSGNRYEGEFKNGKFEGRGIYYYRDGDRYEGEYKNGKKDGKGIYYYNNGDREMGDYANGEEVGKHVILTINGAVNTKNYK